MAAQQDGILRPGAMTAEPCLCGKMHIRIHLADGRFAQADFDVDQVHTLAAALIHCAALLDSDKEASKCH